MSLLPIKVYYLNPGSHAYSSTKGEDTIVYGSADGGRKMHKKNAVFNESIEKIAQHLYLKPHMASNGQDLIYTPTGNLSPLPR